jgi:thiol-disulfide isomerase/thioredoxin
MDTVIALGQSVPKITLPDLEGRQYALQSYHGRVVVLNFWSADCGWCERVDPLLLPHLAAWEAQVALLTIACNPNETPEQLQAAASARGLPGVLLDANHKAADSFGAQTTPHFFVLDQHGILRYRGAFDDVTFRQRSPRRAYLVPAVEALLQGQAPDPADTPAYGCTLVRAT